SVYVLRQPQRSWMAREAWLALVLFPVAALGLWFQTPFLLVPAAVLAMAFLYSQAKILSEAKGIPAWREGRVVPLVVATGLAEGSGLFLVAAMLLAPAGVSPELPAIVAVVLAALRSLIWLNYFAALRRGGTPIRTLEILEAFRPWFFAIGLVL